MMKKLMMTLVAFFAFTLTVSAMSYEQARQQALFLTDKMAYELNLTDDQYEAAYEINLDYLMSIDRYDDLYGVYWRRRNADLSYILYDWQYRAYCAANYFYRPLYYETGYWRFRIYARYPYRDYFYFGRPVFYDTYSGAHSWNMNDNRSWYSGRQFGGGRSFGMRDGFQRGDYGRGVRFGGARTDYRDTDYRSSQRSGSHFGSDSRSYSAPNTPYRTDDSRFGGRRFGASSSGGEGWNGDYERQSSTRSTARNYIEPYNNGGTNRFGGARSSGSSSAESKVELPNNTFSPNRSVGTQPSTSGRSFGGSQGSGGSFRFGGRR